MKRYLLGGGMLFFSYLSFAQVLDANAINPERYLEGRVGINTTKPRATLEIHKESSELLKGAAQGVLFPSLTDQEIDEMEKSQITEGLMLFNKDKQCLIIFNSLGEKECISRKAPVTIGSVVYIEEDNFTVMNNNVQSLVLGYDLPTIEWDTLTETEQVMKGGVSRESFFEINIPKGRYSRNEMEIEIRGIILQFIGNGTDTFVDLSNFEEGELIVSFGMFLDKEKKVYFTQEYRKAYK